ncbi:uncharacterized protein C20orf85-like [Rhinatrema bivittatum]|uniref:uncharacterized protein C20orf85-like n=1 Tax=Rhinatrema bivittatum TaxID=194408 RepID=UPI00112E1FE5|nr:uncharacterized protein C20orf85-like isoform X2 [Rhinatrema bivittatum]XP_029469464.1 uncharacterized protein C20orf85-like [Rhinatrema bivittatum]
MANNTTDKKVDVLTHDRMWKSHVEHEKEAAKKWAYNWGFLTTPYEELIKNEKKKEIVKISVPVHLQVRQGSPIEKYIKVKPSPPVPQTTQGLIGWRSTVPGLELECYGRDQYGKLDFLKQMNWPAEAID